MNKTVPMTTTIIIAVVTAVAAFSGGVYYQKQQGPAWLNQARPGGAFGQGGGQGRMGRMNGGQNGFGGGQGGPGMGQGGNPGGAGGDFRGGPGGTRDISGRLDKLEDGQITLTSPRMGSVKMAIDSKTKIQSAKKADAADLKVGSQVIVQGTMSEDGKMTAKTVIGQ